MPLAEKKKKKTSVGSLNSPPLLSLKKGMNVTIFGHERSPSSPALTALSRGTRHPVPPHSQISAGGGGRGWGWGDEG